MLVKIVTAMDKIYAQAEQLHLRFKKWGTVNKKSIALPEIKKS